MFTQEIEAVEGMHVSDREDFCGPGAGADFDLLPVVIDLPGPGTSGYDAADRLREHHRIDTHPVDHCRIGAQLTHADDSLTAGRLLTALRDLADRAEALPSGRPGAAVCHGPWALVEAGVVVEKGLTSHSSPKTDNP